MTRKHTLTTLLMVVTLGLAACSGGSAPDLGSPGTVAHADEIELSREGVTVEAVGSVEGTPDVLTALVGVEVDATDVDSAYRQANIAAAAVRDALLAAGVENADVQTAQLSLGPEPRRGPDDDPDGYIARTQLRVDVRDLDAAGAVLDEAVAAADGHATLRSLGFGLDDDAALLVDAREAAFEEARAKAEQYADLAGRALGELVGLAEAERPGSPIPGPVAPVREDAVAEDAAPPIEPGEGQVEVRLRATWALE